MLLRCAVYWIPNFVYLFPDAHYVSQVQIFEYSLRIWWIRTIASMTVQEENRHLLRIRTLFTARSRFLYPNKKVHWRTLRVLSHHQLALCLRLTHAPPVRVTTTITSFIPSIIMEIAVITSAIWWVTQRWTILMKYFLRDITFRRNSRHPQPREQDQKWRNHRTATLNWLCNR